MQQFGNQYPQESIPLNEDEARAIAELYAKRQEVRGQPTLGSLAAQLGISESEAASLLTEVRAKVPPAPMNAVPPMGAAMQMPAQDHRRVPAAVWAVAAAVVVVWIGIIGYFALRPSTTDRVFEGSGVFKAADGPAIAVPPMPPGGVTIRRIGPNGEDRTVIINTPTGEISIPDVDRMRAEVERARAETERSAARTDELARRLPDWSP